MRKMLLFSLLLLLFSCKSEYEERLEIAQVLKTKMEVLNSFSEADGVVVKQEIEEIRKEIEFHAKVSGNELLFLEELNLSLGH